MCAYNPSAGEAEVGAFLGLTGQAAQPNQWLPGSDERPFLK